MEKQTAEDILHHALGLSKEDVHAMIQTHVQEEVKKLVTTETIQAEIQKQLQVTEKPVVQSSHTQMEPFLSVAKPEAEKDKPYGIYLHGMLMESYANYQLACEDAKFATAETGIPHEVRIK